VSANLEPAGEEINKNLSLRNRPAGKKTKTQGIICKVLPEIACFFFFMISSGARVAEKL